MVTWLDRRSKCDVIRDDSQRRFLAQHSVAPSLPHCFEWLQHCSPILQRCAALKIIACGYEIGSLSSNKGDEGLYTNITKNRLNMFPEIPNFFILIISNFISIKISRKCSEYLKNIWLHFIYITVKTQK